MKRFFDNFVTVATGRWAVSLPSVALYLPFSFLFSLERENALNTGSFGTQLMVVTGGELVSILFLFVAQATVLSSRKERRQNLALCITVWFSTGLVAGLVSEYYGHYTLGVESHLLMRVANSLLFSGFALGLIAYWFGTLRKIRTERNVLRSLEDLLTVDTSQLNEAQIQAKKLAITNLHSTLLPKVVQLQKLTTGLQKYGTSESLAVALAELESLAGDLNVTLNSKLSELEVSPSLLDLQSQDRLTPVKLISGLFPRVLSVRTSLIILVFGALIGQGTRNGFKGAIVGVLSSIIVVALLQLFRVIGTRANVLKTSWFYPLAYVAIYAFQYLYTTVSATWFMSIANPYQPWYAGLKTVIAIYIASLISTLMIEQNNSLESMSSESAIHRNQIEEMSQEQETLQQITSSTNFGSIQGQISGVIMALNVLTENDGVPTTKRDLSRFIADTNTLLGDAIFEIEHIGAREYSR